MAEDIIQFLSKIFEERKAKNPRYSLRAFARSLSLDSSTLSSIMAGRRKISPKQAVRILQKIGVKDAELQMRMLAPIVGVEIAKAPPYPEMNVELLALVRDWEHHAILAAIDIEPKLTAEQIADHFDLSPERVRTAMDRLKLAGLLERKDGLWRSLKPRQAFLPPIANADIAESHRQHIEKASQSLANDPVNRRDITGTTFRFNPEKMEAVREITREFRQRLASFAEDGATEVYRLNVQLFPLGKGPLK